MADTDIDFKQNNRIIKLEELTAKLGREIGEALEYQGMQDQKLRGAHGVAEDARGIARTAMNLSRGHDTKIATNLNTITTLRSDFDTYKTQVNDRFSAFIAKDSDLERRIIALEQKTRDNRTHLEESVAALTTKFTTLNTTITNLANGGGSTSAETTAKLTQMEERVGTLSTRLQDTQNNLTTANVINVRQGDKIRALQAKVKALETTVSGYDERLIQMAKVNEIQSNDLTQITNEFNTFKTGDGLTSKIDERFQANKETLKTEILTATDARYISKASLCGEIAKCSSFQAVQNKVTALETKITEIEGSSTRPTPLPDSAERAAVIPLTVTPPGRPSYYGEIDSQRTYIKDITGRNPDNLITEQHVIVDDDRWELNYIIPRFAPFFQHGLIVKRLIRDETDPSLNAEILLEEGIDYTLGGWFPECEDDTHGNHVYSLIVFDDFKHNGRYEITYQTFGGQYTLDTAGYTQALANYLDQPLRARWSEIIGRPILYHPDPHQHDVCDMVGFEDVTAGLTLLTNQFKSYIAKEDETRDAFGEFYTLVRELKKQGLGGNSGLKDKIETLMVKVDQNKRNIDTNTTKVNNVINNELAEIKRNIATNKTGIKTNKDAIASLTSKVTTLESRVGDGFVSKATFNTELNNIRNNIGSATNGVRDGLNNLTNNFDAFKREQEAKERDQDAKIAAFTANNQNSGAVLQSRVNALENSYNDFRTSTSNDLTQAKSDIAALRRDHDTLNTSMTLRVNTNSESILKQGEVLKNQITRISTNRDNIKTLKDRVDAMDPSLFVKKTEVQSNWNSLDGNANKVVKFDGFARIKGVEGLFLMRNGTNRSGRLYLNQWNFIHGDAEGFMAPRFTLKMNHQEDHRSEARLDFVTRDNTQLLIWRFQHAISALHVQMRSDRRLKRDIDTLTVSRETLAKLRPVTYTLIETGTPEIGVIAQEVEEVYPQLVSTNQDGMKDVNYSGLVAVLLATVKDLSDKVDTLSAEVAQLRRGEHGTSIR